LDQQPWQTFFGSAPREEKINLLKLLPTPVYLYISDKTKPTLAGLDQIAVSPACLLTFTASSVRIHNVFVVQYTRCYTHSFLSFQACFAVYLLYYIIAFLSGAPFVPSTNPTAKSMD